MTLRLVDVVLVVKSQLSVLNPDRAQRIPEDLTDALVRVSADSLPGNALRAVAAADHESGEVVEVVRRLNGISRGDGS